MRAIICDKCGDVEKDENKLRDYTNLQWKTDFSGFIDNFYLCEKCTKEFKEFTKYKYDESWGCQ